jgi:hypothetical protein
VLAEDRRNPSLHDGIATAREYTGMQTCTPRTWVSVRPSCWKARPSSWTETLPELSSSKNLKVDRISCQIHAADTETSMHLIAELQTWY